VEIKVAEAADMGDLAGLVWRFDGRDGTAAARQHFTTELFRWCESHRGSHVAFLAVLPTAAASGMVWLALTARVPRPDAMGRLCGDVQSLYVVPEHRSTGVGTALVHAVVRHAESLGLEHVTVHSNERARRLYGRTGFRPSGNLLVWTPPDRG